MANHDEEEPVPTGKLASTVTRLAMTSEKPRNFPPPLAKVAVMVAEDPTWRCGQSG